MKFETIETKKEHIEELYKFLRVADIIELKAMHGYVSIDILNESILMSQYYRTVMYNDKVACIYGCVKKGEQGVIWLLGTCYMKQISTFFLKRCRDEINSISTILGCKDLINYVYKKNKSSIKWLKWSGFIVDKKPIIIGAEQREFLYFRRENV